MANVDQCIGPSMLELGSKVGVLSTGKKNHEVLCYLKRFSFNPESHGKAMKDFKQINGMNEIAC